MPIQISIAATAANNSEEVAVEKFPVQFTCPLIAGAETAILEKKASDDVFYTHVQTDGNHIISVINSGATAYGPGVYRVAKGATAAAAYIDLSTPNNP